MTKIFLSFAKSVKLVRIETPQISRFFQKNAYVSVDFLNRSHEFIRLDSNKIPKDKALISKLNFQPNESVMIQTESNSKVNPIEEELKSFINSIESNKTTTQF